MTCGLGDALFIVTPIGFVITNREVALSNPAGAVQVAVAAAGIVAERMLWVDLRLTGDEIARELLECALPLLELLRDGSPAKVSLQVVTFKRKNLLSLREAFD